MVASIDDPPYDIIGNGEPTIGSKPKTIDIFTEINTKIDDANPKQNSFAKKLLAFFPMTATL